VAELSNELADRHRAAREFDRAAAIFDRTRCLVAGRRLAALRGTVAADDSARQSR
jgi:hypothetical protein